MDSSYHKSAVNNMVCMFNFSEVKTDNGKLSDAANEIPASVQPRFTASTQTSSSAALHPSGRKEAGP